MLRLLYYLWSFMMGQYIMLAHIFIFSRCLGQRPGPGQPYEWLTYTDVNAKIKRMGSGLISKGFKPGKYVHVTLNLSF